MGHLCAAPAGQAAASGHTAEAAGTQDEAGADGGVRQHAVAEGRRAPLHDASEGVVIALLERLQQHRRQLTRVCVNKAQGRDVGHRASSTCSTSGRPETLIPSPHETL